MKAARGIITATKWARARAARWMATATKRARAMAARGMATATRLAGDKKGDGNGNKKGNGGGCLTVATIAMGMGTVQRTWPLAL